MRHSFDVESLEVRRHLSSAVESVDGTGNNAAHPLWGSAGVDLIRLAQAAYGNGVNSPALAADKSARTISNLLNNQANPANPSADIATIDQNSLSDYGYAFGQFMDHDLDLTPDGGAEFDIPVDASDPIGPMPLPFTRSQTDPQTGASAANPAQQVTKVTSYFDLSQVYGSSKAVDDALRTFNHGLMKTSPGNMLPYDNSTYFTQAQINALNMANDAHEVPQSALFAAGDVRANENIELTALQTLFLRNHNALAAKLLKSHPTWTDEQLYQEARKLNIAQYQSIVYNEWIPAMLGQTALKPYRGYNAGVNATISNEFSTVAFRMGHSMVSGEIERQDNTGQDIADSIPLAYDFFDPYFLSSTGAVDPLTGQTSTNIDAVLKGEADGNGQAMDMMAVNDIRNLLFGNGGFGGEDLMARDVQRDRDNGIPDYNTLRTAMGLPRVTSFAQITRNVKVQQELAAAYPGGVNTIDAFEGGLAEDHVRGSDVGPLFQVIMVNQFSRLRDGDRFFYLHEHLNSEESRLLAGGNTLAEVIKANTTVTNLQSNVMLFHASVSGSVSASQHHNAMLPGITVELKNEDGDIVATTKTDRNGHYSFNELSRGATNVEVSPGLSSTGRYTVLVVPPTTGQSASALKTFLLSRGDSSFSGMNFTMSASLNQPPLPRPAPPPRMRLQPPPTQMQSAMQGLFGSRDVVDQLLA